MGTGIRHKERNAISKKPAPAASPPTMNTPRFPLVAAILLLVSAGHSPAAVSVTPAVTITFDNPPFSQAQDAYGQGRTYTENGYAFSTTNSSGGSGSIIRFNPALSPSGPSNSSPYFGATLFSNPSFVAADGSPFALLDLRLGGYSSFVSTSAVTLRGMFSGGGTITKTFNIGFQFSTYQLPPEWTNLVRVDFLSTGFSWDDLTVQAVPEPAPAAFASLGLVLFSWLRRRR